MAVTLHAVDALEVLDSRGHPTVRAIVRLSDGSGAAATAQGTAQATAQATTEATTKATTKATAEATVPSGASTGAHEAHELRDGDPTRYGGRGVLRAVAHVRGELADAVRGADPFDQGGIDRALIAADGTPNKSRLGANAILAVSLATALAAARHAGLEPWQYVAGLSGGTAPPRLPLPMINLFSGGKHAGAQVDLQDFLIVPRGADTLADALAMTHAVYYTALEILQRDHGYQPLVADEGGLAPRLASNEAMLELAVQAIEAAGLRPLEDVALAIDVASTHFHEAGGYRLALEGRTLTPPAMVDRLADWQGRYPIVSIEDGLAEDDWEHWPLLTERLGNHCQVLGDDLLVTDPARIERAIAHRAANSALIKVNQVGTLSEALQAIAVARGAGWTTVVSARSGETEDSWLADLATGSGAGQIKVGAITRSERLAKYNRLLAIAHDHPELPYARDVLDRFIP